MGIADTLIFRLSGLQGIVVRPIGAVRKYADISQDAVAAGREQQVDAVVDGSIQIDGDNVRVIARLVRVADGTVIWTDKGEQYGAKLFAAQDAIAEKLVSSLALKLTDKEKARLTKSYTENADAYRLYLLGRYLLNKRTGDSYKKAIGYFEQALEKDPTYALAFSGLADCYTSLGSWQIIPPGEAFRKAREAAEQALVLDDSLAEARVSLGLVKNYSADWRDAEQEFKRAIELNPNYDPAHRWYGAHLMGLGRLDESLAETNRALELDPLSSAYNTQLGRVFYLMRDYDKAIEQYRKTLEVDPDFLIAHLQLGWAYERKGMFAEAIAEYRKAAELQNKSEAGERVGGVGGIEARIGRAYALSGNASEARKILGTLSKDGGVPPYNMALIHDGMGEKELAISYLEKVVEGGGQRFGLKTDPTWDDLRSDPKFQALLARMESGQ
jgi:tetratricopeptide (TPR) repeat protein